MRIIVAALIWIIFKCKYLETTADVNQFDFTMLVVNKIQF